jgi:hypothetical protein
VFALEQLLARVAWLACGLEIAWRAKAELESIMVERRSGG